MFAKITGQPRLGAQLAAPGGALARIAALNRAPVIFAAIAAAALAGAFLAPPMPFIVDGVVYQDMARAMAEEGALHIADNAGIEGAPPLERWLGTARDGKVYPQYPSGYALIAGPFYAALGVRGLMVLNALAGALALALTWRLAMRLYADKTLAWCAVAILGGATYLSNYLFAVWPHALALAFYLGAIACAAEGAARRRARAIAAWLGASGLLVGAGFTVRLDAILALPAILIWLRLFAAPSPADNPDAPPKGSRLAAGALLTGMLPGLALAAWLNWLKFENANPFTYGRTGGLADAAAYAPLLAAGALALAILWLADLKAPARALWRRAPRAVTLGGALAGAGAAAAAWSVVWPALHGAWTLVFDLQALRPDRFQAGVGYNEHGHLLFWGVAKRALIQSLPFAALAVIPVIEFFRGRNASAHALCLLAGAAPVAFYAVNEWHGGGGFNLRYFIPALPFIAVLAAFGFLVLARAPALRARVFCLACILAGALGFLAFQIANAASRGEPAWSVPLELYPQSALFWALALAAAVAALWAKAGPPFRTAAALLAAFTIGYGASVNSFDKARHEKTRAVQLEMGEVIARAIPPGSLILAEYRAILLPAEAKGAHVMEVFDAARAAGVRALKAFAGAGRCVYVQGEGVRRRLLDESPDVGIAETGAFAGPERFRGEPYLVFFSPAGQAEPCALP